MNPVIVKPSQDLDLLQITQSLGLELIDCLKHLKLVSIAINTSDSAWCVSLNAADSGLWRKAASKMSRDEFEMCLTRIGHELRSNCPDLETVSWQLGDEILKCLTQDGSKGSALLEDGVLHGRPIRTEPMSIGDITGGERDNVTVMGQVVELSWRQAKSGDTYGTFVLTDHTSSINVRVFPKEGVLEEVQEGTYLLVRGRARLDRFDSEPVLMCSDLCIANPELRQDLYSKKRVELHLHTKMSALDSVLDLEKAISTAARWGHAAIAVTDHGVVQAFPEAHRLGKKYGIKILYGLEGYLVEDDEKEQAFHIVLLAKNRKGLRNLYELVTLSHLKYFYRSPRIPRKILQEKREGLIIGSACEAGEVYRAVIQGKDGEELEKVASFYDYLEIQPLTNNGFLIDSGAVSSEQELIDANKTIYALAKKLNKPCVATGDVHYVDPEDEIFRTLLLSGKGMGENGERPVPLHLRTTCEFVKEIETYLGKEAAEEVVVANPSVLADVIDDLAPIPKGFFYPTLEDADETLRIITEKGARQVFGDVLPEIVRQRIDQELSAVIGNGFSSLYLIAIKMVEKSLNDGYLVGSRGSVGSSLVAMLTGITEVNPLPPHYVCSSCHWTRFVQDDSYGSGFDLPKMSCPQCGQALTRDGQDIPFETFMGFTGEKVPDIDLNFSGEEQGEILKFAAELLGEKNVYRAGTIGTIARKTAFGFVRHYAESKGKTFGRADEIRLSKGIEGVKRTTGQHPGGVMVIPKGMDVLDFTPLQYPADDRNSGAITTHFDYNSISGHLVKVDILGHDDPTVLRILHELTGVSPTEIPMDDPETLELFSGEDFNQTIGIPEFGTRFVRNMLQDTKPNCFADLVRISGLSHGTHVWANNARDLIKDQTASLEQVIATREDIFLYLMKLGMEPDLAFGIAEKVRKGGQPSDDDILAMKSMSVPDWYIDSCRKISYLFPKAHAAAYVTNSFRIAYFKVHYPLAYYSTYFSFAGSALTTEFMYQKPNEWREHIQKASANAALTAREQDILDALELAIEMEERGFSFGKHDLYESQPIRYIPKGSELIPPFTSIPGLGIQCAMTITKARENGSFDSVEDFKRRTGLGKKMCEVIRDHGLFDGLSETAQLTLF